MVKEFLIIVSAWVILAVGGVALGQDPNLVGQWLFEQIPDDVIKDSSGNGFHGLLQGDASWTLVLDSMALSLGGAGYVQFDDPCPLPITDALTIVAMIQPLDLSARGGILTQGTTGSPWALQLTPEGTLRFVVNWRLNGIEGGIWESSLSVLDQEWAHVAVTFDGTEVCFYVDGTQEVMACDSVLSLGASDEVMTMGADWPGSNDFFVGLMDYVRLYNRALTAAEIVEQLPMRTQAYYPNPEQSATGVLSPILSWQPADGAVAHQVWLGRDANDLIFMAELDQAITQWWYSEGWIPGHDYTWRIDEVMDSGEVVEGVLWQFNALPLTASEPDPANGTNHILTTTTLSWEPGASSYWGQLYLGTDANAVALADEGWPQYMGAFDWDENVLNVTGLESGQTYYWRVDQIGYDGLLWEGDLWQFSTLADPDIEDDTLLIWWPLDEAEGTLAVDHSGYGHHGSIDQPHWTNGRSGAALLFDSEGTLLQTDDETLPSGQDDFAVSLWFYPVTQNEHVLLTWGRGNDDTKVLTLEGHNLFYCYSDLTFCCQAGPLLEQWCHLVLNVSDVGNCQMFLNGVQVEVDKYYEEMEAKRWGSAGFYLGGWPDADLGQYFDGIMDEVRIYDRTLTSEEIALLFAVDANLPYSPVPGDRSNLPTAQAGLLKWSGGSHPDGFEFDVYLGMDYNDVVGADLDSDGVYLGTSEEPNMTFDPLLLEVGETYYWRVDQAVLDGDPIVGDVWRFTVVTGMVIDDFESYSADNRIYATWHDGPGYSDGGVEGNGTGSMVGEVDPPYVNTDVVYSGSQSMPFYYDNYTQDYYYYSEATCTFETPQDWNIDGATTLMLHLTGDPANTAKSTDMIYLRLVDAEGYEMAVEYEDSLAMIVSLDWYRWEIDLESLSQSGLDLGAIESMTLGIGQPDNPQKGKEGVFYVDDIEIGVP